MQRVSAAAFAATIGLAAVLAELILCEISDTIDAVARGMALRITIFLLLVLLVVVIPSLEIYSVIAAAGWMYRGSRAGRPRVAWLLHGLAFGLWILAFWWSGRVMVAQHHRGRGPEEGENVIDTSTENVGVIGISLMALLSGFASVSAPWQSFGARPKPVSEANVARKKTGLEATTDMLAARRSRLRALSRKMSDAPPEGLLKKAMGTIRGHVDVAERRNLELEVSGLENMAVSLSADVSMLQARMHEQRRSKTALGRLVRLASAGFSLYCVFRVLATSLTAVRRRLAPAGAAFVGSDPIHNILGLLVRHYDGQLDREAWTRQLSFALSGLMLLASLSSVLQTFHLFARYAPGLLRAARANLALMVAQICATYVISVALLLRGGIMRGDAVGARLAALGGRDMAWVDAWFEAWFLAGVLLTGLGIWIGRNVGGGPDDWDEDGDVEMGKRS